MNTKVMIKTEKSRSVCITGAGGGLGYDLVLSFLRHTPYKVAAITRNGQSLQQKLNRAEEDTSQVEIIEADITTQTGRAGVYEAMKTLPAMACFIHNAGKLIFKPFLEITEEELKQVYEVNVFSPFLLTQKLISLMKDTHVIQISSIGGIGGSLKFAGLSAYSSSKAALNCLTEMWSEEFKDTAVVFNCLALGSVETEMFKTAFPGATAGSTPRDMADYVVSFALEANKVMRGKIIPVSVINP